MTNNAKNQDKGFTHLNDKGDVRMVDISMKETSKRCAIASARVEMQPETLSKIMDQTLPKGDVLACARVAGIMAAKKTADLIPMCHPLPLTHVEITIEPISQTLIMIKAQAETDGKTGIEMEALTAASIAALTLYDMCKSVDKSMRICSTQLEFKSGGKSGTYQR